MDALSHILARQNASDDASLPAPIPDVDDVVPAHHANAVVAFIIGLAIVTLASVLNAAGLNLTKLDHVHTMAIPKSARRKDWLRPLWLLGMLLYILSQLIGSTLALEYMRAEYVAPLGSTSLIFNFLFARFLVGTPVTSTDIYGTIIVILGVIGIVAFGSINSGLSSETSAAHLAYLWGRAGWIGYFLVMSLALALLYTFTSQLDLVLAARADLSAEPFAGMSARMPVTGTGPLGKARGWARWSLVWIAEKLEDWTAGKDDKVVAWTLGIGWACCGGGMAGECLVFAKAGVALVSGSLSHENPGNQLGHPAPIFTFIFLALTAVLQIVCLNRGLKVYDSTLVVPVFYGVYTATGWLNSLIFNDSVDAYQSWTLFLIFVSILILISGVVLLTHKKPEPGPARDPHTHGGIALSAVPRSPRPGPKTVDGKGAGEHEGLRGEDGAEEVMWDVGEASDDEDDNLATARPATPLSPRPRVQEHSGEEGRHLMSDAHEDDDAHAHVASARAGPPLGRRRSASSALRQSLDEEDEFGAFEGTLSP
ncbi:hypothetical protein FA95DRAFT_1554753 [Auriscalpium vulgare]|uniref:Uncharacterized protein n=1 Tax=Auriscalpium vulgare TaxID=40419 RepID=A0ACB8S4U1_9AGAM|nr:hypothetical protein FA95DRAFT_1554753 [Auriscalpium vulgare]